MKHLATSREKPCVQNRSAKTFEPCWVAVFRSAPFTTHLFSAVFTGLEAAAAPDPAATCPLDDTCWTSTSELTLTSGNHPLRSTPAPTTLPSHQPESCLRRTSTISPASNVISWAITALYGTATRWNPPLRRTPGPGAIVRASASEARVEPLTACRGRVVLVGNAPRPAGQLSCRPAAKSGGGCECAGPARARTKGTSNSSWPRCRLRTTVVPGLPTIAFLTSARVNSRVPTCLRVITCQWALATFRASVAKQRWQTFIRLAELSSCIFKTGMPEAQGSQPGPCLCP